MGCDDGSRITRQRVRGRDNRYVASDDGYVASDNG